MPRLKRLSFCVPRLVGHNTCSTTSHEGMIPLSGRTRRSHLPSIHVSRQKELWLIRYIDMPARSSPGYVRPQNRAVSELQQYPKPH